MSKSNRKKKELLLATGPQRFESRMARLAWKQAPEQEAGQSRGVGMLGNRENGNWKWGEAINPPSDLLPPARFHFLKAPQSPQTVSLTRDPVLKHVNPWGNIFSFKPSQVDSS